jgi:hypothetical protein
MSSPVEVLEEASCFQENITINNINAYYNNNEIKEENNKSYQKLDIQLLENSRIEHIELNNNPYKNRTTPKMFSPIFSSKDKNEIELKNCGTETHKLEVFLSNRSMVYVSPLNKNRVNVTIGDIKNSPFYSNQYDSSKLNNPLNDNNNFYSANVSHLDEFVKNNSNEDYSKTKYYFSNRAKSAYPNDSKFSMNSRKNENELKSYRKDLGRIDLFNNNFVVLKKFYVKKFFCLKRNNEANESLLSEYNYSNSEEVKDNFNRKQKDFDDSHEMIKKSKSHHTNRRNQDLNDINKSNNEEDLDSQKASLKTIHNIENVDYDTENNNKYKVRSSRPINKITKKNEALVINNLYKKNDLIEKEENQTNAELLEQINTDKFSEENNKLNLLKSQDNFDKDLIDQSFNNTRHEVKESITNIGKLQIGPTLTNENEKNTKNESKNDSYSYNNQFKDFENNTHSEIEQPFNDLQTTPAHTFGDEKSKDVDDDKQINNFSDSMNHDNYQEKYDKENNDDFCSKYNYSNLSNKNNCLKSSNCDNNYTSAYSNAYNSNKILTTTKSIIKEKNTDISSNQKLVVELEKVKDKVREVNLKSQKYIHKIINNIPFDLDKKKKKNIYKDNPVIEEKINLNNLKFNYHYRYDNEDWPNNLEKKIGQGNKNSQMNLDIIDNDNKGRFCNCTKRKNNTGTKYNLNKHIKRNSLEYRNLNQEEKSDLKYLYFNHNNRLDSNFTQQTNVSSSNNNKNSNYNDAGILNTSYSLNKTTINSKIHFTNKNSNYNVLLLKEIFSVHLNHLSQGAFLKNYDLLNINLDSFDFNKKESIIKINGYIEKYIYNLPGPICMIACNACLKYRIKIREYLELNKNKIKLFFNLEETREQISSSSQSFSNNKPNLSLLTNKNLIDLNSKLYPSNGKSLIYPSNKIDYLYTKYNDQKDLYMNLNKFN